MIEIVSGFFGPKLLGPGKILNLSEKEEERLVKTGTAVYVQKETHNDDKANDQHENKQTDQEEESDDFYLSEDEIKKMKKEELVSYGTKIGVQDLDSSMRKDELEAAIINFIDENSEDEE
ncbi:hypothetical protein lbkm_0681 [Lachnospiraceae bacterium KM106-2]|nr:hypothetical protein lbkm_0681 [Lachnospiraceae bacterium KM106-2]